MKNRSTISVFDALKAPALFDLTRKGHNPPPKGKRRAHGKGSSEPNSITASRRVKEFPEKFPEEFLEVSGAGKSKIFCIHTLHYIRNNEGLIGQIRWNNRENDVEIWNRKNFWLRTSSIAPLRIMFRSSG